MEFFPVYFQGGDSVTDCIKSGDTFIVDKSYNEPGYNNDPVNVNNVCIYWLVLRT